MVGAVLLGCAPPPCRHAADTRTCCCQYSSSTLLASPLIPCTPPQVMYDRASMMWTLMWRCVQAHPKMRKLQASAGWQRQAGGGGAACVPRCRRSHTLDTHTLACLLLVFPVQGTFWSAHQRFFKQMLIVSGAGRRADAEGWEEGWEGGGRPCSPRGVRACTHLLRLLHLSPLPRQAAKVPHCAQMAKDAVQGGMAVVIGLQSTGWLCEWLVGSRAEPAAGGCQQPHLRLCLLHLCHQRYAVNRCAATFPLPLELCPACSP